MTTQCRREEPLTLVLERIINSPRETVWRCWTDTALLKQWFCPKPWQVPEADFDLRPGGRMNTTMAGPNGERFDNVGCFLEVVPHRRLTFTDFFSEDFVPRAEPFITGYVELSDTADGGTRMIWGARHATEDSLKKHEEMGWEPGWTAASGQLTELAEQLKKENAA